jgi:hypothetical protein
MLVIGVRSWHSPCAERLSLCGASDVVFREHLNHVNWQWVGVACAEHRTSRSLLDPADSRRSHYGFFCFFEMLPVFHLETIVESTRNYIQLLFTR